MVNAGEGDGDVSKLAEVPAAKRKGVKRPQPKLDSHRYLRHQCFHIMDEYKCTIMKNKNMKWSDGVRKSRHQPALLILGKSWAGHD